MVILAKVTGRDLYQDLEETGFHGSAVFTCPRCDCQYRAFYREPPSVTAASTHVFSFETAIEQGHPQHSEARLSFRRTAEGSLVITIPVKKPSGDPKRTPPAASLLGPPFPRKKKDAIKTKE
jgi:hypothetical protein